MADELSTKRIINLPAEYAPAEGDVFVVDNETTGTKKLPINGLIDAASAAMENRIAGIESKIEPITDELGSLYNTIPEMINALTNGQPIYKYRFKTFKRNISGTTITDSETRYRTSQIIKKPESCLIRLTAYGKELVDNSNYEIGFLHISGWNGTTISGTYQLNMDTLGWLNYNYNYSDSEYFAFRVAAPSGVTNEVTDINAVVEAVTISPFYKGETLGYVDAPQIAPYKVQDGTIISDSSDANRSKIWGIAINTENVKYIYSDAVAFDYALQDDSGNILKPFTGSYDECCIEIPTRYNGKNVAKFKANIFMRGRNVGTNLYNYFPMYCERIRIAYKVPVTHAPVPSSDASIAIENAKTIISISEPIDRLFKPLYGTTNPIDSKVIAKIPYRYRDRHQVGYQKSFETYLSCIDACGHNNRSAATVTNGNANGDYGLMCSGFMANVLQSDLLFSTETLKHYKEEFFEPITDLSYAEPGDILFFDGLTGSTKGSNHVALLVDKVTIGGTLAYVVVAEASHKGVGYTTAKAPYKYNDKDTYKINLTKAGIHPVNIKKDAFIPTDATILANYDTNFGYKKVYSGINPLTFRSFWGNKVNIPSTSLQNIVLKSTNSVPNYQTIKVYKDSMLIGTHTVADLLTETGTSYCQFPMASVVNGDGYYEIKTSAEELLAEFYIYTRTIKSTDDSINLEPLFDMGFYPDKTYIRYMVETGQGRADQYVYRHITAEEITSKSVTFTGTEDRIFSFNKYGGIDAIIENNSGDDEGDIPT